MRKQFKKALSMVLSAAMVLTLGSGVQVKAANAEKACDAYIAYVNGDWSMQYWGPGNASNKDVEQNAVKADGDGHYELSLTTTSGQAVGTAVMFVEIKNLKKQLGSDANIQATNAKVVLDGERQVTLDSNVGYGYNGDDYRINIYNPWTGDKGDTLVSALGDQAETLTFNTLTISFDLEGTGWGAKSTPAPTQEPTDEPSQPGQTPGAGSTSGAGTTSGAGSTSGEATQAPTDAPTQAPTDAPTQEPTGDSYIDKELWAKKGLHAYVSYQTATWDYRNAYAPGAVGKKETYDYIQASGAEINAEEAKVTDVSKRCFAPAGSDMWCCKFTCIHTYVGQQYPARVLTHHF